MQTKFTLIDITIQNDPRKLKLPQQTIFHLELHRTINYQSIISLNNLKVGYNSLKKQASFFINSNQNLNSIVYIKTGYDVQYNRIIEELIEGSKLISSNQIQMKPKSYQKTVIIENMHNLKVSLKFRGEYDPFRKYSTTRHRVCSLDKLLLKQENNIRVLQSDITRTNSNRQGSLKRPKNIKKSLYENIRDLICHVSDSNQDIDQNNQKNFIILQPDLQLQSVISQNSLNYHNMTASMRAYPRNRQSRI